MNLFIYESNTIDFTSRGLGALTDVILDTPPLVREKLNAEFSLEFDYPYDGRNFNLIKEERIVKASTPQGFQPFRIYKIKKDLDFITVYANHIIYDLGGNWIEDTFIQKKSGQEAINQLLSKCIIPHQFKATSNIAETLSSRLVRKNPIEAMIGDKDNSLRNRGGGEFGFDNFNITWMARRGKDRGFTIKYRKNLIGLDFTTDLSAVVTKIQPIGFDGLLLPEKYVDSPLIKKYAVVKTKEIKYEDVISKKLNPDHEDAIDHEKALSKLREYSKKEFENDIDKPQIDCTVNFIDLRQTEEYKDYKHLQDLQMGDDCYIEASKYGVKIKKRMTYYEWNAFHERYELITLNEGAEATYNMGLTGTINSIVNNNLEEVYTQINHVRTSADGKNTIYTGPDKPLNAQKGDVWFRVETDGTETLLKFDGIEWIESVGSKTFKAMKEDLEKSKKLIEEAEAKAEAHKESIDLEIKEIDEKIKKIDGVKKEDLDEIRQKLSDTSETTEMVAELVGSDGRTTYNKNRATVTEGTLKLGDKYLEITHNGDGFEVGKEYTISFEAECEEYAFYKVAYNFDVTKMFPTKIIMTPNNEFLPVGQKEFKDKEGTIHGVYKDTYTITAESDWYKLKPIIKEINSDEEILINFEFKNIADGNIKEKYLGEWSDKPELILDGGGE